MGPTHWRLHGEKTTPSTAANKDELQFRWFHEKGCSLKVSPDTTMTEKQLGGGNHDSKEKHGN